ncbi:flagellar assembly protein FliH [Kineobactrum sediminis]|nr:flagellar assembly protein FliH [Kineobactrum sediminis]
MSDILPRENLTDMDRWEFGDVTAEKPPKPADPKTSGGYLHSARALEALQKQAHDEAYARGLEEGRAAGRAEMIRKGAAVEALLGSMLQPLKDIDAEVEDELVQLTLAVARQVLHRELLLAPEQVIAAVREAMAELPSNSREIRLLLHPQDAALVREAIPVPAGPAGWRIEEDPGIARGGCKVFSANTLVDATLDSRMQAVAARVLGGDHFDNAAPTVPLSVERFT